MQESAASILVSGIIVCQDILKEYEQVDELLMAIKESCWLREDSRQDGDADDIESDFLAKANVDDVETSNIPKDLLRNRDKLNYLVFYLFERRFGWSEQESSSSQLNESKSKQSNSTSGVGSPYRRLKTGSLPYAEETRIKTMLNTKLDELINLFATEEKLNSQLLEAYVFAISEASCLPVVRSQLLCHIYSWLTLIVCDETVINNAVFHLIKLIVIAGVTDVWSAIRNTSVSRITAFLEFLSLEQLEEIFLTFAQICNDASSTWQAKEGAIMAITGILQCFKLAIVQKSVLFKEASSSSGTVVCRRFGKHHFISLPLFISEPLQKTVYTLLSNSQLSIKEHANRAFCSFLLRSEFSEVLNAFKEVLLYLANKAFCSRKEFTHEWKFAEAYSVDGYIKAAEFLVKNVPVEYILHNWNLCFATFSHYLMHPASTVRQAASSVLKYLAAKQTQTLVFPKLVTQNLMYGWKTNVTSLLEPLSTLASAAQRSSVKRIEKDQKGDFDVTESWEWREGRLFAYELILKFLIANHIHYTFPAYTLTRNVHSRNSTEEHRNSIDGHNKFSVSHNFGSKRGRGFSRHEALSRSLTMESDPVTQKFISSLVEKEKARTQTFSLLEIMRKSEAETTNYDFDNLEVSLCEGDDVENAVTEESIKKLQDFREDQLSKSELPLQGAEKVSFGKVLVQIFLQTLECLADTRWELRRMAHQVLPLISETIRFYDAKILENLWELHLSFNSSLLGFGACVSLRDSLAHVAKLVKYFENPPGFWKDIDRCRLAAKRIVDSINEKLPGLLIKVEEIVNRRSFDRLTIISIEVLMLSIIHFPQNQMKKQMVAVIVKKIQKLFTHAYPDNPYGSYLLSNDPDKSTDFESAAAGVLSCGQKNTKVVTRACKVQDVLFMDIQRLLSGFLRSSALDDVVPFLPILLHEINSLIEAGTEVQPFFQACHVLLKDKNPSYQELSPSSKTVLNIAADEICLLIRNKALETHFLRQYLDVLLVLLRILDKVANLRTVFTAIASKMSSEGASSTVLHNCDNQIDEFVKENSEDEFLRIRMLSNDIRQSPIEDVHIITEDDQEDSPRNLPESQALGESFDVNSNIDKADEQRNQSPIERAASPFDEDYDSDWDSWEDEEESLSQIRDAFKTFLLNLKDTSISESWFNQALKDCELKDRKIVESLIS